MKKLAGLIAAFLVATTLAASLSSTNAAQTIEYTAQDLKVDAAIAIYFTEGDGRSQPYYFSLSGELTPTLKMVLFRNVRSTSTRSRSSERSTNVE